MWNVKAFCATIHVTIQDARPEQLPIHMICNMICSSYDSTVKKKGYSCEKRGFARYETKELRKIGSGAVSYAWAQTESGKLADI